MARSKKTPQPAPEPAVPASPEGAETSVSAEPALPPIPPEREAAIHARIDALGLSRISLAVAAPASSAPRPPRVSRLPSSPALKALFLLGPVALVGVGLYWAAGGSWPSLGDRVSESAPPAPVTQAAGRGEVPVPTAAPAGSPPERAVVAEAPKATPDRPTRAVPPPASPPSGGSEKTAASPPPTAPERSEDAWRTPGRPLPWVTGPGETRPGDAGVSGGVRPVPWETPRGGEWAPGSHAAVPLDVPRPPAVPEVPPRTEPPAPPAVPQPAAPPAPAATAATVAPWAPSEYRPTAPAVPEAPRPVAEPQPARAAEAPRPPAAAAAPRPAYPTQPVYPGYAAPYGWAPQPYYPYAVPGRSQ